MTTSFKLYQNPTIKMIKFPSKIWKMSTRKLIILSYFTSFIHMILFTLEHLEVFKHTKI